MLLNRMWLIRLTTTSKYCMHHMTAILYHMTGVITEAQLPYSDVISSDSPSVEEMKAVVCDQQHRPPVEDKWSTDEVYISLTHTHTHTHMQTSSQYTHSHIHTHANIISVHTLTLTHTHSHCPTFLISSRNAGVQRVMNVPSPHLLITSLINYLIIHYNYINNHCWTRTAWLLSNHTNPKKRISPPNCLIENKFY